MSACEIRCDLNRVSAETFAAAHEEVERLREDLRRAVELLAEPRDDEVRRLRAEVTATREAVGRVTTLIAPETEMAATTAFGQRCFTEADIRRALDGGTDGN
jgi:hypothetical protein